MADELNLLPCPFCGSTNIDPAEWSQNDGKSGPGCGDCGALGESVEAWNRRAAPAAAQLDADSLPPHDARAVLSGSPCWTEGKVRQIVAPYAERIRLLTEELATFKAEHATDQEPKP